MSWYIKNMNRWRGNAKAYSMSQRIGMASFFWANVCTLLYINFERFVCKRRSHHIWFSITSAAATLKSFHSITVVVLLYFAIIVWREMWYWYMYMYSECIPYLVGLGCYVCCTWEASGFRARIMCHMCAENHCQLQAKCIRLASCINHSVEHYISIVVKYQHLVHNLQLWFPLYVRVTA